MNATHHPAGAPQVKVGAGKRSGELKPEEKGEFGCYDVYFNWLSGSPTKSNVRFVIRDVLAKNEREAHLLYRAHLERSEPIAEATSLLNIDLHANLRRLATGEEYGAFVAETFTLRPDLITEHQRLQAPLAPQRIAVGGGFKL